MLLLFLLLRLIERLLIVIDTCMGPTDLNQRDDILGRCITGIHKVQSHFVQVKGLQSRIVFFLLLFF